MNNLIIRLNYPQLRNETHVEYHEDVNVLFGTYTPASLGIAPQYNVYKAAYDVEVSALDVMRKSAYTSEIYEQDHKRDVIFSGLADAVKSGTKHFDPAKKEAAHRLKNVLDHYGNIAVRTIDQESAAIDDMLRELQMPDYAADVATLALGDWTAQLGTENSTLKTLMQERYAEIAQRPTAKMRTSRTATDLAFRALLNQVEALALVNGAAGYTLFVNELNVISERYKNILAQQAGARHKHQQ